MVSKSSQHVVDKFCIVSGFSLGSYGGTLSLSRNCAIDTHYPKSFSPEKKKTEILLMPVAEETDACTVREEVFPSI